MPIAQIENLIRYVTNAEVTVVRFGASRQTLPLFSC